MAKKAASNAPTTTYLNDKKTMVTPLGTALWAAIDKPDEKYGAKFKTSLILDKSSKEFKTFINQVKAIVKGAKLDPNLVDSLIKDGEDKEGNPQTYLSFTSKAFINEDTGQYRPPTVYNSKNEVIKARVWGGDEIRVGFKLAHWKTPMGQGIKMYLDSVQLLKKGAGGSSMESAFESDDSYDPVSSPVDTVGGVSSSVSASSLPDNDEDTEGDDGDVI